MRTVLVTGGTSNLGAAICRLFIEEGYSVIATYAHNKEGAQALKQELGENLTIERLDLLDEGCVLSLFSKIEKLDILVNNSGLFSLSDQQDLKADEWDRVFDTNVKGLFLVTKAALPLLRRSEDASIINIASINALHPGFGQTAHYDASKGAVVAYTKSLAAEVAPIRVNAVAPGLLDAPYLSDPSNPIRVTFESRAPLKRMVKVEEVASCVSFLSHARAITGEVIVVDCGYLVG
ncbi:MAG TPA: SDR family NAD(P)-dependent oxidoreductase [Sphaerochaeta sp.]|nr:SDR family NAD(P)-dependent oxidoreductase [Sphaerochaeta sp.]